MLLPDFKLDSRANQSWEYSGMDSPAGCFNKSHFKRYPYSVTYDYNSRGYRDNEWPDTIEELHECIWCFGDSFTAGIGSPLKHTWPYLLQQETGKRCINVSMDGASNQWIARHVREVINICNPDTLVINWTYVTRSESDDSSLSDEERRIGYYEDKSNGSYDQMHNYYVSFLDTIKEFKYCAVNTSVPGALDRSSWKELVESCSGIDISDLPYPEEHLLYQRLVNETEHFIEYKQVDRARDYHHFDIKTSDILVRRILEHI